MYIGKQVPPHAPLEVVMPFKSKAQRRKFAELLVNGKISDETYEEWNRSTGTAQLPERIHPKPPATSRKRKAAPRSRRTGKGRTRAQSKKATRAQSGVKARGRKP